MKTIVLSSLLFCSLLITGQNQRTGQINPHPETVNSLKPAKRTFINQPVAQKTANQTGSAWFNIVDFIEAVFPATQVFSPMHVFPDSTIILGFDSGNQPVNTWIHKAGVYVDPSFMFQQVIITDKLATYTVDSLSVGYIYERHSSNAIKDSLIFQVVGENHALDWTTSTGTFPYQDITYDYINNDIDHSGANKTPLLKRIAIPLNIQDTCEGGVYKQLKVAVTGVAPQTNSKKIGVVISYKPGYTYNNTDTLIGSHRTNTFYILSSEQNGTNTDPTVFGVANDYTSDMDMSYILPTDVRYNQSSTGWDGYFLPTYAYTTPFAYETHDIGLKLSVNITGVKEIEQKGFFLAQNTPNPFNNSSVVEFELAKDASSAVFTVTDMTGRIISSEKVPATVGVHSVKLGVYAAGVYYYSLNVDGKTTSKKMIVQ